MIYLFKAHRIRPDFLVVHAQQRAGLDIVKTAVLHQKLDGRPCVGASLDLVQEHQRLAGDHDLPGIGRKIGDEGIRIQISGKNLCGPGVCDKIDLDKMHVLLPPKLPDEGGLSGLSGT